MKPAVLLTIACFTAVGAEPSVHVFMAPTNVPQSVLTPAQASAASMFESIGVQVLWDRTEEPASDGVHIRIEISTRSPRDSRPGALAFAHPYGGYTRSITVFYDRIRDNAAGSITMEHALFAHVLVHEMSHVLQGVNRHSDQGVMKARWGSRDYSQMLWKRMPFTPYDVNLIRAGLWGRPPGLPSPQ